MESNRKRQQTYGKENGVPEGTGMSLKEYDFLANSASTMDCTGLMYRVPEDDIERMNYQQVYRYEPPEDEK